MPAERPRPRLRYGVLLRSTLAPFGAEPLLRRRAELSFGTFSRLWTKLACLLSAGPTPTEARRSGLFGLVGSAGALCAAVAGRLADRPRSPAPRWSRASSLHGHRLPGHADHEPEPH